MVGTGCETGCKRLRQFPAVDNPTRSGGCRGVTHLVRPPLPRSTAEVIHAVAGRLPPPRVPLTPKCLLHKALARSHRRDPLKMSGRVRLPRIRDATRPVGT